MAKCKTILLWILALQLFNMSIYSDAYWQFFNGNIDSALEYSNVDPTETFVEWLVELKMGQQEMFTYSTHNTDSKNVVKVLAWHMDMDRHLQNDIFFPADENTVYHPEKVSRIPAIAFDILTPPPNAGISI